MHAYVKSIDENAEYMKMEIHCFLKKLSTLNFPISESSDATSHTKEENKLSRQQFHILALLSAD